MLEERTLTSHDELAQRAALLSSRGLGIPGGETCILGLYDGDELVATGSIVGDTLQGIAVSRSKEGEGLMAILLSALLKRIPHLAAPSQNIRIFTAACNADIFSSLGFSVVMSTGSVVLLEWRKMFKNYLDQLAAMAVPAPIAAGVVMNANPVTLGHVYLVNQALRYAKRVYVFVVQEDRSQFRFSDRLHMVKLALANTEAVVLPSGPYMISSATFPSYFIKEEQYAAIHAELDLRLFVEQAHALGINMRFIGDEQMCATTSTYNDVMKRFLPTKGIKVMEIGRLKKNGLPVTASAVRSLLQSGNTEAAFNLVPEASREYLASCF